MNNYVIGAHILGATTIPSVGQTYHDKKTVLAVQRALSARGFPIATDGIMGSKTANAIRAFQKSIGQAQTGVIDYGVLLGLGVKRGTWGSGGEGDQGPPADMALKPPVSQAPTTPAGVVAQQTALAKAAQEVRAAGPSFWAQPVWRGASVKRWQAVVGTGGGLLLAVGIGLLFIGRR